MKLDVAAYAKINLTLDVLSKRNDGYHNVRMVMQTIDLKDQLTFSPQPQGIKIKVNNPQLPTGKKNLVYQAVELLFDEFEISEGIEVKINKHIPIAAGLAGGSTDAAAALWAVNKLWKLGLTTEELMVRAAKLGADVPFCLVGGTKLATGIGTEIDNLPPVPELNLVVVNPPYEISTPEIYNHFSGFTANAATDKLLAKLKGKNNKEQIISNLSNDLGSVAVSLYPELQSLKQQVNKLTKKAIISGSGPTVLGFVEGRKTAQQVVEKLQAELTADYKIVKARTINSGVKGEIVSSR